MIFARVVLLLSAAAFAGIGAAFLAAPASMAEAVGLSLSGAVADNDVRAVYGGLQLGCAALLGLGAGDPARARHALAAQMLLFGGLACGRAVSWITAGSPGALGVLLQGAELVALACGWLALRRLPEPAPR